LDRDPGSDALAGSLLLGVGLACAPSWARRARAKPAPATPAY